ncbi:oxygenase MpaB family protein [Arthrobacter alpinus]|nr:oxygenase MpaB family protein [Arthrobacter alpinus]
MGIRILMPLARFLTAGLLPPTVRDMYGLAWSPRKDWLLNACFRMMSLLVSITPKLIRHAPMRFYLRRIPD